jgi:hypothetical protein
MHQKLDLPEGWHSIGEELPDEKLVVHSSWAAAQLVELPTARDGTLDTRYAASGTGNTSSRIADAELALVHDPEMGL